ncbi:HEPN domain-containing protein [Agrobacterium fabrum]|nr:HEPN domain-containing protein [Agrobacterium fabrum]
MSLVTTDALNILIDAQRDLQVTGFERYNYDPTFGTDYPTHLYESVKNHYPFNELTDSWLAWGDDGFGVNIAEAIGKWLTFKLLFREKPEQLIAILEKLISENQADFADVYVCRGVGVASQEDLGNRAYLVPPDFFKDLAGNQQLFAPPSGLNISKASSALVLPFHMDPVLIKSGMERPRPSSPSSLKRARLATVIRQALVLSGSVAIRIPEKFRISLTPQYPYQPNRVDTFEGEAAIAIGPNPDLGLARSLIGQLEKFADPRPIDIAVERINRARSAPNDTDAAIDYGIALEVTLMYGDAAANQEISNKLGMRAGWLIGADLHHRLDIKTKASRLYSARSDAAHRGYLRDETQKKFIKSEADRLTVECLLRVLKIGRFPDWTKLQFGDVG